MGAPAPFETVRNRLLLLSPDRTMADSTPELGVGCKVAVFAAIFDEEDEERWSVQQFGSAADTTVLLCEIRCVTRDGWKVNVPYDDTQYTLIDSQFTHDASTCHKCWPIDPSTLLDDPSGFGPSPLTMRVPTAGMMRSPLGRDSLGSYDTEDDTALATLAAVTVATLPQPPIPPAEPEPAAPPAALEAFENSGAAAPRRAGRPAVAAGRRSAAPPSEIDDPREDGLDESSDDDIPGLEDDSDSDDDTRVPPGGLGRGSGRDAVRGRGRGPRRARSPQHAETDEIVQRHRVKWTKGGVRAVDPRLSGGMGYTGRPRLKLFNFTEKSERDFMEHCFPNSLVTGIVEATTTTGRSLIRQSFSVTTGEIWRFLGIKMYMMIYPQEGPREDYWQKKATDAAGHNDEVFIFHDIGQYGMSSARYRDIERAFSLTTYGKADDVFNPIRRFADEWNQNMANAIDPGEFITVDESMGGWLGKGMPGLMKVPRKPTDVGRESHTTACAETGVIIHAEIYEGKKLMENKEYIKPHGKNPAKAMRCTKPWHGSGRTVILDSGFMSVECATGLYDLGLFSIGNVKTASKGFPKDWLLSQVKQRGDEATATAEVKSRRGTTVHLLATADRDKQPMTLLGTAGTSNRGKTLHRRFTTIRADGTYNVREADLNQMEMQEKYRALFNALDKHNAVRQGGACLETSWHTHKWFVRDFQMLWGISEVNAWLIWKYFLTGSKANVTFAEFRRRLCYQLLYNPHILREEEEAAQTRSRSGASASTSGRHSQILIGFTDKGARLRKSCRYCSAKCDYMCPCTPGLRDAPGIYCCSTRSGRDCFFRHIEGEAAPNKMSESMRDRHKRRRDGAG